MIEDILFIFRKLDPWAIFWGAILSILWLATLEGIIKPLIAYQTQRLARRMLPIVFDKLDPIMPSFIAKLTPEEIEAKIFNEFLGLGLTEAQAEAMTREFDRRFSVFEAARKISTEENKKQ
ncbi:MAG: hypothetical protein ACK421_08360 [Pseudanabaenaceae cyanobacterium]